jgi:2-amino-4-hydroxy-6-hydroxymethyldihydropteridine diphosphokinase
VGLGSNIGDRRRQLLCAIARLSKRAPVRRVSSFYSTEPVGHRAQRRFWNAAAEILWRGSPEGLLRTVQEIERRCGRTPTFAGGPREIDVDILDLGGLVTEKADLVLPHPRLQERRFALAPLAEIAPTWRHPISGQTARETLAKLPRRPGVRRISANSRRV